VKQIDSEDKKPTGRKVIGRQTDKAAPWRPAGVRQIDRRQKIDSRQADGYLQGDTQATGIRIEWLAAGRQAGGKQTVWRQAVRLAAGRQAGGRQKG
jgi:hypothetical protein